MNFNIEKLLQVAKPASEAVKAEATFRKENEEWLRKSAKIALAVRRELRLHGMSQQDLAVKMALSPQYVGRILKGQENLTLETISKLEGAIGKILIRVGGEEHLSSSPSQTFIICIPSFEVSEWELSSQLFYRKERQVVKES